MLNSLIENLAQDESRDLPVAGLEHAVAAVIETCDVQLDWTFTPIDDPATGLAESQCRGSTITLTSDSGTWLLIALCDLDSARRLTRELFAMDDDDEMMVEDIADAMNEIVNVAAGVFKSRRDECGERLSIGLPTYLDGDEAFSSLSDRVARQSRVLGTDDSVCSRVIVFWQKGANSGRLHT